MKASGGWLGICMPEKFGGSNLGIEKRLFMQTISESGEEWQPHHLFI